MSAPAPAIPASPRTTLRDFAYGCLGALSPVAVNALGLLSANSQLQKNLDYMVGRYHMNPILFTVMVTFYIVCAGFFAKAWKPDSDYKAIWVGASFGALVANMSLNLPAK